MRISSNDRIGQKFFRLTVLNVFRDNKITIADCICECGNKKNIILSSLVTGNTKSCGCYNDELRQQLNGYTIHGLSYHPLHAIWDGMKARCLNPNRKSYKNYGGRGVKICDEWKNDFMAFYNWSIQNGWERGLQIDKDIKGNGLLYSPETCCWVTQKRNANNTRRNHYLEYGGERMTLAEFSEKINISPKLVSLRFRRGWSIERIVSTPVFNQTKAA